MGGWQEDMLQEAKDLHRQLTSGKKESVKLVWIATRKDKDINYKILCQFNKKPVTRKIPVVKEDLV